MLMLWKKGEEASKQAETCRSGSTHTGRKFQKMLRG